VTSGYQRRAIENSGEPAYLQIARLLEEEIESGALAPGDRLPSTAQMCEEFKVSPNVVKAAVSILRTKKLVIGMQGKAVFVTGLDDRDPDVEVTEDLMTELKQIRQAIRDLGARLARIESAVFPESAPAPRRGR
jgi:GntR family transcriptional regulator